MTKLSHFTNRKKQVLLEDGQASIKIDIKEMFERYNEYINSLVDNSSMNDKEEVRIDILDSLFRAFNEYNIESGKSFLEFANSYLDVK